VPVRATTRSRATAPAASRSSSGIDRWICSAVVVRPTNDAAPIGVPPSETVALICGVSASNRW
jgi:hypothetical protein